MPTVTDLFRAEDVGRAAVALGQFIANLPDRTSPEDDPTAMTIYEAEIDSAAEVTLNAALSPEARAVLEVAKDRGRIIEALGNALLRLPRDYIDIAFARSLETKTDDR